MKRQVIAVNEFGIDADGHDYSIGATTEAIQAGFMVNLPVTLVFPDGRRFDTTQARLTPVGIAMMEKTFGVGGAA